MNVPFLYVAQLPVSNPLCNPSGVDTTEAGSQDLFGPERDSETPDLVLQDPRSAVAPPRPLVSSSMHPHMHFLQWLCCLHRVGGGDRGPEALWLSPDGDAGSVLVDTVGQLLRSVVAACREPPPLHDLVPDACRAAARAMELLCRRRQPSVELRRRVEESLREMTAMLLHGSRPSRVSRVFAP